MGLPPDERDDGAESATPARLQTSELFSSGNLDHSHTQGNFHDSARRTRPSTSKVLANQSIFAAIAYNDNFQNTTLVVIVLNAFWIMFDIEWNHNSIPEDGTWLKRAKPLPKVVENIFCFYFTAEVVIRFLAFKYKCLFYRDAWFVFDSLLVSCMVLETWIIEIIALIQGSDGNSSFVSNFSALRLLRLLRLTRIARLMRMFPELMTLVKGMARAAMGVFWTLLALTIVMYVFAILFTNFTGDPENTEPPPDTCEHMFGTMGDAMMSLFTNGVLGDNLNMACQAILDCGKTPIMEENDDGDMEWTGAFEETQHTFTAYFLYWLFMFFFALSSLTLLNMLIGLLCEVISKTAESEEETAKIRDLRLCTEDAFEAIDTNADGRVCEAEWEKIKNDEQVRSQLSALGVENDERLDQMQGTIFAKAKGHEGDPREDGLELEELIRKVIEVRPNKPVSILDMEIVKHKVLKKDRFFQHRLESVERLIVDMLARKGVPIPSMTSGSSVNTEVVGPIPMLRDIPTQEIMNEIRGRAHRLIPSKGAAKPAPPAPHPSAPGFAPWGPKSPREVKTPCEEPKTMVVEASDLSPNLKPIVPA